MSEDLIKEYEAIIKSKILNYRLDSAFDSVGKLIYNFPNCESGYYHKGLCQFAKEEYKEAAELFKDAIKINPGFAKAYFNLGVCYYMDDLFDEALINVAKALIIFSKTKEEDSKERCIGAIKIIEEEKNQWQASL